MKINRKKQQIFIAFIDIILLTAAVYLSLWIRDLNNPSISRFYEHLVYFIPIIISWLICLYTANFYSLEISQTDYKAIAKIAVIAVLCTLLGWAFFYLNLRARLVPKTILVIHSIIVSILIIFWRRINFKIAVKYNDNFIAILGYNDTVNELLQNINKFPYMSYKVKFIYDAEDKKASNLYVIKDPQVFTEEIINNNVQMVVVADKEKIPDTTQNILFNLLKKKIYFIDLEDFYEIYMRKIPLNAINELWLLKNIDLRKNNLYRPVKEIIDKIMAVLLLFASLPFWPLIIILIKIESKGTAFFIQERTGYLGKIFKIIKFRTMKVADNKLQPTVREDIRITKFGKFLRKTRIDEIPQFINIIKGEMSFIGPRPERQELIQKLEHEVPFYRQRLLVKPGLSGWDQVSGEYHSPSKEDTYKKLQNDLYYIKNMSLFLDISIFFKTFVTIFKRGGV